MPVAFKRTRILVAAIAMLCGSAALTAQTPPPAPNKPVTPSTPATPAKVDPAAKAVLERYLEVTGGRAKYEAIKTRHITMKTEFVGQGLVANMSIKQSLPDKIVSKTEIAGIGTMEQALVDGIGWSRNPMEGLRILEGKELEQLRFQGMSELANLNPEKIFSSIELKGETVVDGKTFVEVSLDGPTGKILQQYDKATGLLASMSMTVTSPQGDLEVVSKLSDYKEVGGVLWPHTTEASVGPMVIKSTLVNVQINPAFDADTFKIPDDVKAAAGK
jgi:zinc protease